MPNPGPTNQHSPTLAAHRRKHATHPATIHQPSHLTPGPLAHAKGQPLNGSTNQPINQSIAIDASISMIDSRQDVVKDDGEGHGELEAELRPSGLDPVRPSERLEQICALLKLLL